MPRVKRVTRSRFCVDMYNNKIIIVYKNIIIYLVICTQDVKLMLMMNLGTTLNLPDVFSIVYILIYILFSVLRQMSELELFQLLHRLPLMLGNTFAVN